MARHRRGRHRRLTPILVKAVRVIVYAGGLGVLAWLWATDVPDTPLPQFPAAETSTVAATPPVTITVPPVEVTTSAAPPPPPPPSPLAATGPAEERPAATTSRATAARSTTKQPPASPPPARESEPDEDDEEGDRQSIVSAARSFLGLGIPYVWGGKSLAGMDCSGYIWRVLQKAGYDVPYRTSSALRAWTTPVGRSEARPGDLVFWPGHAAIYAGNGRVYDSGSTSFGVTERDMWPGARFGRVPIGAG